jgi:hypothetical protein
MSEQTFITDDGGVGYGPASWDGEPLYCRETVAELAYDPTVTRLFDPVAFEQIGGQMALEGGDDGCE